MWMKSTKVQNPRRVESCELCQCACAGIGHAPRCSSNAWCVLSVLAPTRASGFVLGKAECCWRSLGKLGIPLRFCNHNCEYQYACVPLLVSVPRPHVKMEEEGSFYVWSGYRDYTAFAMKKNGHLNVWNTTAAPLDLSNGASSEKTPQIFLTFVARWVRDSVFRTNKCSIREIWLNGHTQTNPTTVTLAAHARRG